MSVSSARRRLSRRASCISSSSSVTRCAASSVGRPSLRAMRLRHVAQPGHGSGSRPVRRSSVEPSWPRQDSLVRRPSTRRRRAPVPRPRSATKEDALVIGMVLAAGAGRRLRPYTDTLPKALVPVDGDTTILDIALRNLAAVDLRDVVVVVGYAAGAVEERQAAWRRGTAYASPWCTTTRPRSGTTPTRCGWRATQ